MNKCRIMMQSMLWLKLENFEWTRHKSFGMYQFWYWESIFNIRSLFTLCIAHIVLTWKLWNLERYIKNYLLDKHLNMFLFFKIINIKEIPHLHNKKFNKNCGVKLNKYSMCHLPLTSTVMAEDGYLTNCCLVYLINLK